MAEANAQGRCVPMFNAVARRYTRSHQSRMLTVKKKPAIRYQPPCCSGGTCNPYWGGGGSRASHGSCRMNSTGSQPTEAHIFRPMISKARNPKSSENVPAVPK